MEHRDIKKFLKNLNINNLPPDSRRDLKRTAAQLDRKQRQSVVREDFLSFVKYMWPAFIEGSHHKIVAEKFNKLRECVEIIKEKKPFKKIEFKISNESAWEVGLACGGEIAVYLEQIS